MNENQNTKQEPSPIEWKELDEAVRRWAVTSGWEKDSEYYRKLKEDYE